MNAKLVGNRRWTVNASGVITSLTRRYVAVRDALPTSGGAADDEVASITGLPALKSAHKANSPLICTGYSFEEGTDGAKKVIWIDVNFATDSTDGGDANRPPQGQAVEAYGWRSGTVSRDLVRDAGTGELLVNSAGLPFDSVPQIDIPAPTFSKVVKTASRQAWAQYLGKINSSATSVGGVSCGIHCLRCVQLDEERLWNDEFGFKYRYTIGCQLMANSVCINGETSPTDIGWDVAVVDCGMMERTEDGETKMISIPSTESGQETFVSSPVLLDGEGHANLAAGAKPYVFRVQAYPEAAFPNDFFSEPV